MARRKKMIPDIDIADGLVISGEAEFDTEPRFKTLLMKGFVVYLVVMGAMGCLLSSFDIPYNAVVINIAVLAGAMFSSFLYYTKIWENVGYFFLFTFMFGTAMMFRRYISSGFFAVVNIISERFAYYFDTEVVQGYAESVSNRDVTVTIAFVYVGWVFAILLNALISRQMKYFAVMFTAFLFLLVPFYLEREPDMLYLLMLMAGCIIVYAFRGGRHTPITTNDQRFEYMPKKRHINYVYSATHHIRAIVLFVGMVVLFAGIFQIFVHKYDFETTKRGKSEWKQETEGTFANIYKNGLWGLFNRYDSTGGLRSGVLGGVNSVNLDYETDLEVTYVPYSMDRVYLRSFIGDTYMPYGNRWQHTVPRLKISDDGLEKKYEVVLEEYMNTSGAEKTSATAKLLKERYETGSELSAKARMDVRNIAAPLGSYLPYYVDEEGNTALDMMGYRNTYGVNFYPWLTNPGVSDDINTDGDTSAKDDTKADKGKDTANKEKAGKVQKAGNEAKSGKDKKADNDSETDDHKTYDEIISEIETLLVDGMYMEVPDDNVTVVDEFIREAGLEKYRKSNPIEAVEALGSYFQENIPYTYQPGATPRETDFVNYFLADNKKGYCAHFASAAVLILRRLGYPARYIEGYAIDPSDIVEDGRIRNDLDVKDYYQGDSLLDSASSPVTVNVTDAMAHAWVEVRVDGHWRIAELTPATTESAPGGGFLRDLINFFAGSSVGSSDTNEITDSGAGGAGLDTVGRLAGYGILAAAGLAALLLVIYLLWRRMSYAIRYLRASKEDKLIMYFGRKSSKSEKNGEKTINYRDRVAHMRELGKLKISESEADDLTDILERAGFSESGITAEEYERAKGYF
ncbi:MAG: hypothetical protein IJ807_05770 [Eubacterium sp.]|nr:hypothetical protein [Eubacterium sp.]